jgi:hypothetical protein
MGIRTCRGQLSRRKGRHAGTTSLLAVHKRREFMGLWFPVMKMPAIAMSLKQNQRCSPMHPHIASTHSLHFRSHGQVERPVNVTNRVKSKAKQAAPPQEVEVSSHATTHSLHVRAHRLWSASSASFWRMLNALADVQPNTRPDKSLQYQRRVT